MVFLLAGTIFGATPAFGQLRATFRDYRTFPGNPVLSTNPNYTYTTDFGTGSRVTMTFTGPQTYTTQAIDGFKLAMDSPQTYGFTGGLSYTAPQEMPTRTHTIGIRVYIKDDSGAGPELCSKTGEPATVSSGQTGSVSAAISCTLTQIGYYNNSAQDNIQRNLSSLQYWADVTIDGVTQNVRLFGFWQNVSIRNSITLFNPSPSPQVRLAPGTSQAFSASANVTLLGRDNGEIDFRIVDQAGTLQTSPVTQSVSYTGFQRFELSIPAFTIGPGVTRLDLKGSLRNGDQILAESPLISYTVGDDCGLTGRLYREGRLGIYPLPDAAVELWDVTASERLVDKVKAQLKGTFDVPDASYCFKLPASFDYTKRYQIRVRLRDSLEETGAKILIAPSQASILPTEIRWQPFTMTAGTTTRKDLKVDESEIVIPAGTKDTLYAAAEIYWHMWRQVYLMMPLNTTVALSRDLPVEVHLNGTPTSFYCPTNDPAGCLVPSSIVLDRTDSVPGANPSVIWHEFGHHLIRELYAGEIPRPAMSTDRLLDLNHNGFANDYTSASMDEGFATFWAVATSQVFEIPQGRNPRFRWNTPTPTTSSALNLDLNFRAVTQASGPGVTNDEEIAFAGLLWDLVDTRVDPLEAAGSGVASDSAEVSLPDVLSVFAQARPGSVARLRTALAAKFPALAAAPAPPATGLSPLDQLFVLHGFFADANPADLRYSDGEAVGPAANGAVWNGYALASATAGTTGTPKVVQARPNRENLRQVPGALLDVRFRDEQGNEVPTAGLDVKVVFPPGL
ncbi:MAG: hypothetical protein JNK60_14300, partial [Acidobacteria bacterium]|nr:hypothetical protein [Acidobacteriota bacterium]